MRSLLPGSAVAFLLLASAFSAQAQDDVHRCGNVYTNRPCPSGVQQEPLAVPSRVAPIARDTGRARYGGAGEPAAQGAPAPGSDAAAARRDRERGRMPGRPESGLNRRSSLDSAPGAFSRPRAATTGRGGSRMTLDEMERQVLLAKTEIDLVCRGQGVANDPAAKTVCSSAASGVSMTGLPLRR